MVKVLMQRKDLRLNLNNLRHLLYINQCKDGLTLPSATTASDEAISE